MPEIKPTPERAPVQPEKMEGRPEALDKFESPKIPEKKDKASEIAVKIKSSAPAFTPPPVGAVSLQQIEQVLSEDLEDIYFRLAPDLQQKFKQKGEETAHKLKELLNKTKINVKKIAKLIVDWLKMIPGVNKYFLEQESKIKVDNILKLRKDDGGV